MSTPAVRRALGAITLAGFALLGTLAFVLWRVLPPVVPVTRAAERAKPFAGVPALPSALGQPRLAGITAAVLIEPENVRITGPGAYDSTTAAWRRWLREADVRIVAPEEADVLIAAEAVCLGPLHRRLIAAHLARGGGLVSTGALGASDGVCTPLRDTLLASLLGIADADIRRAPKRTTAYYAVVLGETVLGAGLPPGPRIELSPQAEIAFRTRTREVLYSDYERGPVSAGGPYFDAAAMRSRVGPGRVVAFGFSPTAVVGDWGRDVVRLLVGNAVRWAAGHHVFQLAPWPDGRKAAAVLSHDVEADYRNARLALDALEPYGLPGTAFIVGQLAEDDPETTRRLIARMEIATHTHHHAALDTMSDRAEAAELALSKTATERLLGRPVLGLRPPEERFDMSTLQAWADLGGTYVFVNNDMRSAGPEIIPLLPDSLVLLGRVSEDDFEILNRDRIRDRNRMTQRMIGQLNEMVAYRGLYMFSYHSHMFSQKQLVPVLEAIADELRRRPEIWTATAGDVAAWWRGRSRVDVIPDATGDGITMRNAGVHPFTRGVVLIDAPDGGRRAVALPVVQAGASVRVRADGSIAAAQ